ncbi:MAG: hypothetical protein DME64_00340 [Verrucomicrobia bacterium]|nr:MAG: hypothetical protein DME64_00340 [Verrucomicrobiota bacterium]
MRGQTRQESVNRKSLNRYIVFRIHGPRITNYVVKNRACIRIAALLRERVLRFTSITRYQATLSLL